MNNFLYRSLPDSVTSGISTEFTYTHTPVTVDTGDELMRTAPVFTVRDSTIGSTVSGSSGRRPNKPPLMSLYIDTAAATQHIYTAYRCLISQFRQPTLPRTLGQMLEQTLVGWQVLFDGRCCASWQVVWQVLCSKRHGKRQRFGLMAGASCYHGRCPSVCPSVCTRQPTSVCPSVCPSVCGSEAV